ncbi:MAG TPA: polysaccharide biosynthesis tyrosine autokinase [Mycobacteriales bacterium]|nr:polysaccharide biosynthesis tyrosine autokinase [Mycobacteriales bacterium]
MDLRDYARLLRVRRTLILTCLLLGLGSAAVATLAATPVYEARTTLFVAAAGDVAGASAAQAGNLFTQQRVKSYAEIVPSPRVTSPVVDSLGLALTPEQLAGKIEASAPLDSVLLNISVRDTSPELAARLTNAVAEQMIDVVDELERTSGAATSPVKLSVVTPASVPGSPVSPRPALNLALGALVGLAVGVGAAVARETLDQRVKTPQQLQDQHELATLGVIAYDADAPKRPLIAHVAPQSPRAEAFRQLRTNLQFADIDQPPRSIVVTSSLAQEGKSTTTCNLAITLAQAGIDVVLVEGDLRRPRLGDYLGIEGAVGLTDVLIGRVEVDDALQHWGSTGTLRVLPSGPCPPNPSELLGSRQMADVLHRLENRGLVLIDGPPLLPVTDAAVIARQVSGAVLVVRVNSTRNDHVAKALGDLRGVGAHVYGAILNMAPTKGPDAYRYGYGYGYYGYSQTQTAGKRAAGRDGRGSRGRPAPALPDPGQAARAGSA